MKRKSPLCETSKGWGTRFAYLFLICPLVQWTGKGEVISVCIGKAEDKPIMTDDDISKHYTLQIFPAEIRKDSGGTAYIAVELQAMQIGGDKSLRTSFSNMDEFMNRLGAMLCSDALRWRQIEDVLKQQGILSVAGSDAELAFTAGELRELGLVEADALRAA
jgi:hypothetical protein